MPLLKGKSQKTISHNIREMMHGKMVAKLKKKYGAKRAQKVAIAAAYSTARRSR